MRVATGMSSQTSQTPRNIEENNTEEIKPALTALETETQAPSTTLKRSGMLWGLRGGLLESISAALSYAISAFAIIMFNKVVLSTYQFRSPVFMTFCHMCVSLSFTVILKVQGLVSYPDFSWKTLLEMLPLSICFVGNIVLGLMSTKVVSVPVMTTLRRLTALVIIPLEYFILLKLPTRQNVIPVVIMLFGALMTGWGDMYFDMLGYGIVILNDLATAGYLVFVKKAGKKDLGKFGTLFYNTFLSCPMLFCLCLLMGEFNYVRHFEYLHDLNFQICFTCSACLAFLVNLTTVWCTHANSALTTSITGQMKNILTTVAGMILFHDYKPTFFANFGIGVSILGSFYYAYKKTQSQSMGHVPKEKESPHSQSAETEKFIKQKENTV